MIYADDLIEALEKTLEELRNRYDQAKAKFDEAEFTGTGSIPEKTVVIALRMASYSGACGAIEGVIAELEG